VKKIRDHLGRVVSTAIKCKKENCYYNRESYCKREDIEITGFGMCANILMPTFIVDENFKIIGRKFGNFKAEYYSKE
jgi:hypothetical protein